MLSAERPCIKGERGRGEKHTRVVACQCPSSQYCSSQLQMPRFPPARCTQYAGLINIQYTRIVSAYRTHIPGKERGGGNGNNNDEGEREMA